MTKRQLKHAKRLYKHICACGLAWSEIKDVLTNAVELKKMYELWGIIK